LTPSQLRALVPTLAVLPEQQATELDHEIDDSTARFPFALFARRR